MVGTGTRSGVAPALCRGVTGVAPGSAGARGASTAPGTGRGVKLIVLVHL